MATHTIVRVQGWYQVVETGADGTVTSIGSFRTEADALDWLKAYKRVQTGGEVFKVGHSPSPQSVADDPPIDKPKPD